MKVCIKLSREGKKMKKDKKEKNIQNKKRREYNAGKIFGKIMAGMLLIFMVAGTFATLIFALQ